ncbi:MAG: porin, partial [Hyphomicrobiales bacterium]
GQFAISGSNEGEVELGDAWITIGENILVGRETSRFDFGGGYGIYDGYYVDEGINQFTFIMPFGNGFSATIGLEDGRDRVALPADVDTGGGFNWSEAFSTSHVGGMEIPDVVASLRLSQAWGSAQISGALHQLRPIADDTPNTQVTDEQFGWAVQAGVEVNISSATKVKAVAAYADGALAYVGGSSFIEVGVQDTNGVLVGTYLGEILETLSGWYVLGAVSHDFSDQLNLSATVAYHEFEEQADILYLGATAEYEVVENLVVSVAGNYVSTDYSGAALNALGDVVDTTDTDAWEAKLRVQRNF